MFYKHSQSNKVQNCTQHVAVTVSTVKPTLTGICNAGHIIRSLATFVKEKPAENTYTHSELP